MKAQATGSKRTRLRAAIDDDIINMSIDIDPHSLPNIDIPKERGQEFLDALAALCAQGCNGVTLIWALRLGRAARGLSVPSIPSAKVIRAVAIRLETLASEIEKLEESGFLMTVVREETKRLWDERSLGMEEIEDLGETPPHLDVQRWMRKKADMYRRWLEIASLRIAPKTGTMLTRLEYLYPALYVYEATGKTHIALLLNMLSIIGVKVDESQLRREFRSLKRNYRWLLMDMQSKLYIVRDRTISWYGSEFPIIKEQQ